MFPLRDISVKIVSNGLNFEISFPTPSNFPMFKTNFLIPFMAAVSFEPDKSLNSPLITSTTPETILKPVSAVVMAPRAYPTLFCRFRIDPLQSRCNPIQCARNGTVNKIGSDRKKILKKS